MGPDLVWNCSIPCEGHTLTFGLGTAVGALAARKGGGQFCCWDAGIAGPLWEALWTRGRAKFLPLGLGSRVCAKDRGR